MLPQITPFYIAPNNTPQYALNNPYKGECQLIVRSWGIDTAVYKNGKEQRKGMISEKKWSKKILRILFFDMIFGAWSFSNKKEISEDFEKFGFWTIIRYNPHLNRENHIFVCIFYDLKYISLMPPEKQFPLNFLIFFPANWKVVEDVIGEVYMMYQRYYSNVFVYSS